MIDTDYYGTLKSRLDKAGVELVAVSKTQPVERIRELYDLGQRVFGENRVQELTEKRALLPGDISWHLIGHLQRNKVRQVIGQVAMIESVDSVRLLKTLAKEAARAGETVDILLQLKIAQEETKYGFDPRTIIGQLRADDLAGIQGIRVRGVMGMASFVDNESQVRSEFANLRKQFERLKSVLFTDAPHFDQISMGMSGDYHIAIEEGSTMVRIGSLIFGPRT